MVLLVFFFSAVLLWVSALALLQVLAVVLFQVLAKVLRWGFCGGSCFVPDSCCGSVSVFFCLSVLGFCSGFAAYSCGGSISGTC